MVIFGHRLRITWILWKSNLLKVSQVNLLSRFQRKRRCWKLLFGIIRILRLEKHPKLRVKEQKLPRKEKIYLMKSMNWHLFGKRNNFQSAMNRSISLYPSVQRMSLFLIVQIICWTSKCRPETGIMTIKRRKCSGTLNDLILVRFLSWMSRALSFNNIIINPYFIDMHSDFVGEYV